MNIRVAVSRTAVARLVAAAFLAAAVAALSATTAVTSVRAGIAVCSMLVSSESSPVPAETATAFVGEQGMITGTGFLPNTDLEAEVTVDGVSMGLFTIPTDASGGFVLSGTIAPEQQGVLVLTASEPDDGCSDSVTVTVLAAPVATPTPEALPDAAMPPVKPAPGGPAVFAGLLLYAALATLTAVTLRSRRATTRD
jgi:hypothetical protein